MELHNTTEDTVIAKVNEIFEGFEKEGNPGKFCTCDQCRMDVVCYALNRVAPHYLVSNRGASRIHPETLERQQQTADITAVIYEGLKRVFHNQRPNCSKPGEQDAAGSDAQPVFNIPTIMGRIFDGHNFAPLADAMIELLWKGEQVPMKNGNWDNPHRLVANTEGAFSFWPAPATASKVNTHRIFEYTLRVSSPGLETLSHYFKVPVASETQEAASFNLDRTFKLPDLYMFPPGEAEKNGYLD